MKQEPKFEAVVGFHGQALDGADRGFYIEVLMGSFIKEEDAAHVAGVKYGHIELDGYTPDGEFEQISTIAFLEGKLFVFLEKKRIPEDHPDIEIKVYQYHPDDHYLSTDKKVLWDISLDSLQKRSTESDSINFNSILRASRLIKNKV